MIESIDLKPTLNTGIGLAFIAAIPLFLLWAWLSFRVLRSESSGEKKVYRRAITFFLVMTPVLLFDLARLRFHWHIGPIEPELSTWGVFAIRWVWVGSVAHATWILYGAAAGPFFRRFRRRPPAPGIEGDPFLGDLEPPPIEPPISISRAREQRITSIALGFRQIGDELTQISARIERGPSPFLPRDDRRKEHA